ncbi:transposase family protein [Microcoleus sp. LEGE 07076]|uniref:transposase family protein n=1 Tax=Microcoleus sp. LEGE 07076 TaxID=915322 RepID=UPI001880814F|nr:transposase family protein [Microcoleus sp. LEGE 07076]
MSSLAIVEAFSELPDPRRGAGCRHEYAVCLALFTLAISAGCGGFLAIGDWLKAYREPKNCAVWVPEAWDSFLQYASSGVTGLGLSILWRLRRFFLQN